MRASTASAALTSNGSLTTLEFIRQRTRPDSLIGVVAYNGVIFIQLKADVWNV
jgi:hypothetical protein